MVTIDPGENTGISGSNGESITVTAYPQRVEDDDAAIVEFSAEVGELSSENDLDVDFVVYAYTNLDSVDIDDNGRLGQDDSPNATLSEEDLSQNTSITGSIEVTFPELDDNTQNSQETFWLLAGFDYHGASGYSEDFNFPDYRAASSKKQLQLIQPTSPPAEQVTLTDDNISIDRTTGEDNSPAQAIFGQRADFRIIDIQFERDAEISDIFAQPTGTVGTGDEKQNLYEIVFDYAGNPNISIDTGGRFVKHEIVGGPVVRQKVGEEPNNYSIDGVCHQDTAKKIDALKHARFGKIASDRIPGRRGQAVQFASASTEPLAEGGAVDIPTDNTAPAELLYTYSINAIEVQRNIEAASSTSDIPDNISGGL